MTERTRVAVIGAGQIAESVHLPGYRRRGELELVAVVGPQAAKVREFAERNRIPKYYTDAAEMLASERPAMVSVCTPNRFHYEYVMQALSAGCHVLCEKPPAMSAEQAREMHELANKKQRVLAYNFHHRFTEDVRLIAEQARTGVLGEIYVAKVQALRRCGIPGWGHFIDKEMQGGGPLADIGVHMLDAALYVMDFPRIEKVTARMYQKIGTRKSSGTLGEWDPEKFQVEDSLFGFIECEGGRLIQLETSFALNIKEASIMNVQFCGDRAGATLFPAQVYRDDGGELVPILGREIADNQRHEKSMEAFIGKCLGKDVMLAGGEQGYQIQQLVDALYRAATTGTVVPL